MTHLKISQLAKNEWLWFAVLMVGTTAFYVWFGWRWISGIVYDQGWYLQVSSRVAQGDMLYRDVLWAYPPLPVLLLSWLMQFGRHDIAYYSLINILLAVLATVVLYFIHRFIFSPRNAVLATLVVTIGFGTCLVFLRTYTPGVSFGALAVLIMLWGILKALRNQDDRIVVLLVAIAIAVSCLSKPEFAFVACGLGTCMLIFLWRVRIESADTVRAWRAIFFGMAIGLGIAGAVYIGIASNAGMDNLWAGLKGYDRLLARPLLDQLFGYGILGRANIILALVWILIAGITLSKMKERFQIVAIVGLVFFYFLSSLVLASGWIGRIRNSEISPLQISELLPSIAKIPMYAWLDWFQAQTFLVLSMVALSLFVCLFLRWAKRWSSAKTVPQGQWITWVVVLCIQLGSLRYVFEGNMFLLFGMFLLMGTLASESLVFHPPRCPQQFMLAMLWLMPLLGGLTREWYSTTAGDPSMLVSPYGAVVVSRASREFVETILPYISDHSKSQDAIAVLGLFPGIYYLSGRQNPFRQDYQGIGIGVSESDAPEFLDRLERFAPVILLAPEGYWNIGILAVNVPAESLWMNWGGQPAFGSQASRVEKYILDHYRFDRILGSPGSFQLAAFRRVW